MGHQRGRNDDCPCGSGKKYKKCCLLKESNVIKSNTLQFISPIQTNSQDTLSHLLHSQTEYYPIDYIKPVKKLSNNVYDIISDESIFQEHYCVSLVIMHTLPKSLRNDIEAKLVTLCDKYELENIHFTDILGGTNILGSRNKDFINEYIEILKSLNLSCLSISESKEKLLSRYNVKTLTNEVIFFNLFWENFLRIIPSSKDDFIIHIWKEQENNFNDKITLESFSKLLTGIEHIFNQYPDKYISICKYPMFFTKRSLLMSSLSDLVAYVSNKVQNKIDKGISLKKIRKEHFYSLKLIKDIFDNYSGLTSKELIELVDNLYRDFDNPNWVKWFSLDDLKNLHE